RCRVVWKRPNGVSKETQHEVSHFVDCVLNKKKPETDAYSALQGLRVIWKLYEAEKLGINADLRGMGLEE
ncbi:MAG: hypothetical protein IJF32_05975, partial [Oscillospiraceae bacterium]|nr:hypothetical protein [Oscillospiraceae bacterium]